MFVVENFLQALAVILNGLLTVYWWVVVAAVVVSWVGADPYNPIVNFLRRATEPVFYRIRSAVPLVFGGIDFTPLVVLLGIEFLRLFLVRTLFDASAGLGGQASSEFLP